VLSGRAFHKINLIAHNGGYQRGRIPQVGILGFRGELGPRIGRPHCWNIDLLADLAEVIPVII